MSKRKAQATKVEVGTGNVYADLGYDDADEMLIKAQLVTKIAEIIKRKALPKRRRPTCLACPSLSCRTCYAAGSAVFPSVA